MNSLSTAMKYGLDRLYCYISHLEELKLTYEVCELMYYNNSPSFLRIRKYITCHFPSWMILIWCFFVVGILTKLYLDFILNLQWKGVTLLQWIISFLTLSYIVAEQFGLGYCKLGPYLLPWTLSAQLINYDSKMLTHLRL